MEKETVDQVWAKLVKTENRQLKLSQKHSTNHAYLGGARGESRQKKREHGVSWTSNTGVEKITVGREANVTGEYLQSERVPQLGTERKIKNVNARS